MGRGLAAAAPEGVLRGLVAAAAAARDLAAVAAPVTRGLAAAAPAAAASGLAAAAAANGTAAAVKQLFVTVMA